MFRLLKNLHVMYTALFNLAKQFRDQGTTSIGIRGGDAVYAPSTAAVADAFAHKKRQLALFLEAELDLGQPGSVLIAARRKLA